MELMETCPAACTLLIGLWCECDDDGVFDWKPRTINARYASSAKADIDQILSELERTNFIRRFERDGKPYAAAKNFQRWQRPQKPKSRGLLPPEMNEYVGASDTDTGPVQDQYDTDIGNLPQREEGGGRVEEEDSTSLRSVDRPVKPRKTKPPPVLKTEFEEFYQAYPRHEGKGAAREKYKIARRKADHEAILAGARRAAAAYSEREKRFIPLPATWLHQERWTDEIPAANGHDPPPADDLTPEERQQARLAHFRKTGRWPEHWGPKPETEP